MPPHCTPGHSSYFLFPAINILLRETEKLPSTVLDILNGENLTNYTFLPEGQYVDFRRKESSIDLPDML